MQAEAPSARARAALQSVELIELQEGRARVRARDAAAAQFVRTRADILADLFQKLVGAPVRVDLIESPEPDAAPEPYDQSSVSADERRAIEHPLVRRTMELFGASLRGVDDAPPKSAPDTPEN